MPLARLTDCAIHYERDGDGPPLVLVAGLGGRGSYWAAQAAALRGHFTVVTFDHRGCGRSPAAPPPYSVEQWAGDLLGLLDHLDIGAAVLVGHSTGGAICQALAAAAPGRAQALLLSATWAAADARFRQVFELRRRVLQGLGTADYASLGALLTAPGPAALDETPLLAPAAPAGPPEPVAVTDGRLAALLAWEAGDRLWRIAVPTLVAAVADDLLIPPAMARPILAAMPHAAFRLLPAGGHHAPQTRPALFNDTVLELCDRAGGDWARAAAAARQAARSEG